MSRRSFHTPLLVCGLCAVTVIGLGGFFLWPLIPTSLWEVDDNSNDVTATVDHGRNTRASQSLWFLAHVRSPDGRPVAGARVTAAPVRYDESGSRRSNRPFAVITGHQRFRSQTTDTQGFVTSRVSDSTRIADDAKVEVLAYHPKFGTAYTITSLPQLGVQEAISLELRRGAAIKGRVVDESGNPLADSWVSVSFSLPGKLLYGEGFEGVSDQEVEWDEGLSGHTHGRGHFFIPGLIYEDSRVMTVVIRPPPWDYSVAVRVHPEQYDETTKTWKLGDVVVTERALQFAQRRRGSRGGKRATPPPPSVGK